MKSDLCLRCSCAAVRMDTAGCRKKFRQFYYFTAVAIVQVRGNGGHRLRMWTRKRAERGRLLEELK